MLRGRDKDIDALREGIRVQEREAIFRERFEDIQKRTWVREPALRLAIELKVGDRLVACDSAGSFYENGEVTGIGTRTANSGTVRPGHVWVEYTTRNSGTGGSQWEYGRLILSVRGRPSA